MFEIYPQICMLPIFPSLQLTDLVLNLIIFCILLISSSPGKRWLYNSQSLYSIISKSSIFIFIEKNLKYCFLPVPAIVSVQRHMHVCSIYKESLRIFNTWGYNLEMEHWTLSTSLSYKTKFSKAFMLCDDTRPRKHNFTSLEFLSADYCWQSLWQWPLA